MTYDEIKKELENLPMTWYPALIKVVVEAAIKKGVFICGGATNFVKRIELEAKQPAANRVSNEP